VEAILATITPIGDAAAEALDGAADGSTETAPGTGGGPTLELPEGWTQVTVGDATFGVPNDLDTLELTPTDGPPCHNGIDGVRTYLAPDGYPTGVLQDRDPGGLLPEHTTHVGCRYRLAHYTSLLAAPLGTVPVSVREQQDADAQDHVAVRATTMTTPGGLHGERITVGDHLVTYALPQVDLWLEFHNPQQDSELADQVLATITSTRPLEDASASEEPTAAANRIELPDWGETGEISPDAVTHGVLKGDPGEGCVWLHEGLEEGEDFDQVIALMWHEGYALDTSTMDVLDPAGQPVASVGDTVSLGGGEVPHLQPERCAVSDRVWMVSSIEPTG
jgi:hypothetical protein